MIQEAGSQELDVEKQGLGIGLVEEFPQEEFREKKR
jgi:hypothetical protein